MNVSIDKNIEKIIAKPIEDMGYSLLRIKLIGSKQITMQVMIEHQDDSPITVEDCVRVSREISTLLEVYNPLEAPYNLEVSSPGIDRPLVKLEDFEKYKDFYAQITLHEPFQGAKRLKGLLEGVVDDKIAYWPDHHKCDVPILIDISEIKTAKLIITDELLQKMQ